MTKNVVVIGAGHAGAHAAVSLRDLGFEGAITLVSDEAQLPYQRPPLSKSYLLGKQDGDALLLKSPEVYAEQRIKYLSGNRAVAIDRSGRVVVLADGQKLPYDKVILATGGRRAVLSAPGAELDGVVGLRTFSDAADIKARLGAVRNVVVIGGGFIGLEFASVARSLDVNVCLVELAGRLLGRSVSEITARHVEDVHRANGVSLCFGEKVVALHGQGRLQSLELSSGKSLPAELALVGVGMTPNVDLAAAAGLDVLDGVLVDTFLRTSDPDVLAIGDCARFPANDAMMRVESVQNATDQARHAAHTITGQLVPYSALPWFWSDQGGMKLQMAGLAQTADRFVLRGAPASGSFSVFCFCADRLVAVESVNRGTDHIMGRRLIAANAALTEQQASDESFPLKNAISPNRGAPPGDGVTRTASNVRSLDERMK